MVKLFNYLLLFLLLGIFPKQDTSSFLPLHCPPQWGVLGGAIPNNISFLNVNQASHKQPINPCDIYGQIYEEKDRRRSQFLVYIEPENDYRSNLIVFKEVNALMADGKGLWYFTESRGFADYTVCFVEDRSIADFVIYYTDKPHYAGCR